MYELIYSKSTIIIKVLLCNNIKYNPEFQQKRCMYYDRKIMTKMISRIKIGAHTHTHAGNHPQCNSAITVVVCVRHYTLHTVTIDNK